MKAALPFYRVDELGKPTLNRIERLEEFNDLP